MLYDDVGVFYAEADFALRCTRWRPGADDLVFPGMLASVDDDRRFDAQLVAGVHTLRFPSAAADVQADDVVTTQQPLAGGQYGPASTWRVLRTPVRIIDGAESVAYLAPEQPT
jgi:hypothetical protein